MGSAILMLGWVPLEQSGEGEGAQALLQEDRAQKPPVCISCLPRGLEGGRAGGRDRGREKEDSFFGKNEIFFHLTSKNV